MSHKRSTKKAQPVKDEREQIDKPRNPFEENSETGDDKIFIECYGATVYKPGTGEIEAGVRFLDEKDPSKGYEIVGHQVFAPDHKKRRLIKKSHWGSIRRCQACQDLTVRLLRPEGPDFFIPNPRQPNKRQLKSVPKNW